MKPRRSRTRKTGMIVILLAAFTTHSPASVPRAGWESQNSERLLLALESTQSVGQTSGARLRVHRTGMRTLEPTIGRTRSGALFINAMREGSGSTTPEVARSTDGGHNWEFVSPRIAVQNSHPITADPYIYVDETTDRVFTVDLTVACSFLSFSDDEGETWTTNPWACGVPVNDHQSIFAGPPVSSSTVGYENVVYYCFNQLLRSVCSKSLDGGIAFLPTASPAFDVSGNEGGCNGGLHGHGVVDSKGTVYLPAGTCGNPMLAISSDEGDTWERVHVAGKNTRVGGSVPSVAVDREGNIYYVWVGQDRRIYLAVSSDGGLTWGPAVPVSARGLTASSLPSIDVGGPGYAAITYMATYETEERVLSSNARWFGQIRASANALSHTPRFFGGSVGGPHDPLILGDCLDRCGAAYDFLDVIVSSSGIAWATFVDACRKLECLGLSDGLDRRHGQYVFGEGIVAELVRFRSRP